MTDRDKYRWRQRWRPDGTEDVVILDNRDSFVFNLAHRLFEVGVKAAIVRSDEVSVEELMSFSPRGLVISPGPGHPDDAGVSVEAIRRFAGQIPILGVCLGHQAIAVAFGGTVEEGGRPMHGMASEIAHDGTGVFSGLEERFDAARYHSLVATKLSEELVANGWADDFVMGIRHRTYEVHGVQFHPESILSPSGYKLLANFVELLR